MTWLFEGKEIIEIPEGYIGFVYCIENLTNGRKYIGKKLFLFSKTTYKTIKLKNGTKKRKKIRSKVESDWKFYTGSNLELNNDIKKLGIENFKREILHYGKTKAECSYIEAKLQFQYQVLESSNFYNNIIQIKIHGSHILGKI